MFPLPMTTGIDFTQIPTQLGLALNISPFAAGILASAFLLLMFSMPILIFSKNLMLATIMTILILCCTVAMTWLPYWCLLIIIFMCALLFASEMRTWITGRGH
jgi:hypothetical protein